jgi:preprotein translocase subunit YajC
MGTSDLFLFVVLGGMIALMYVNSRKRKRQLAELKDSIKVGAQVVLHSGILGKVVSKDSDRLVIETTPGTKLTVLDGAVRGLDSWKATSTTAKSASSAKPAAKAVAKASSAKKPSGSGVAKKAPSSSTKK